MSIKHLKVLNGYPETIPVPKGHHIKIYGKDQRYFFQIFPDIKFRYYGGEKIRCLVLEEIDVYLGEDYLSNRYDQWIKIINEEDSPLEIAIEFIPVNIYK